LFKDIPNLRLLQDEEEVFEGVRFWGATLWTDMNNCNPVDMGACQAGMNDYHLIYTTPEGLPLTPSETIHEHNVSKFKLMETLWKDRETPTVVITHHAPTLKSIHADHVNSAINYAYASRMENIILENPQIKYWIHGHTHRSTKYQVGDCWVLANQCGYYMEHSYRIFNANESFEL
jgi:hypothetical protein